MGGPNKKVNFREKEKQILDKILGPAHYDRRIRPSGVNGTGFFLFFFNLYQSRLRMPLASSSLHPSIVV